MKKTKLFLDLGLLLIQIKKILTYEGLNIYLHIVCCDWIVFSLRYTRKRGKITECFLCLGRFWKIFRYYFGLMDNFQLLLLLYFFGFFFTFLPAHIFCYSNIVSIPSKARSKSYCLTQPLLLLGKSRIRSKSGICFLFQWFWWLLFFYSFFLLTWLRCWISWPYSLFLISLFWSISRACLFLSRGYLLPWNLFDCL